MLHFQFLKYFTMQDIDEKVLRVEYLPGEGTRRTRRRKLLKKRAKLAAKASCAFSAILDRLLLTCGSHETQNLQPSELELFLQAKKLELINPVENSQPSSSMDLCPGTPPPTQKSNSGDTSLCEDETTSNSELVANSGQQQDAEEEEVCRADLSSAVLLLSQSDEQCEEKSEELAVRPTKKRRIYANGNYRDYYTKRLGPEQQEDPRLLAMQRRWFTNRCCLDIGCNAGLLTLEIVKRFHCQSMRGIDVDLNLIKQACRLLREEKGRAAKGVEEAQASRRMREVNKAYCQVKALCNVWFQAGDILTSELEEEYFDTVTCMSVTKWIHIFSGDEGLKAFFNKVKHLLRPGGYFVLEPQPWKSYKQALNKLRGGEHTPLDLGTLRLRPEGFVEYLTKEVGFRLLQQQGADAVVAGFNRPIYWFKIEK